MGNWHPGNPRLQTLYPKGALSKCVTKHPKKRSKYSEMVVTYLPENVFCTFYAKSYGKFIQGNPVVSQIIGNFFYQH